MWKEACDAPNVILAFKGAQRVEPNSDGGESIQNCDFGWGMDDLVTVIRDHTPGSSTTKKLVLSTVRVQHPDKHVSLSASVEAEGKHFGVTLLSLIPGVPSLSRSAKTDGYEYLVYDACAKPLKKGKVSPVL